MDNKTVTMDYDTHQEMLKELEELKEAKLTTITVLRDNGIFYNNYRRFYSANFKVDSTEELKPIIEKLIEDLKESVIAPERYQNICLQEKIRKQEADILELNKRISEKKWYEFIPMKEK